METLVSALWLHRHKPSNIQSVWNLHWRNSLELSGHVPRVLHTHPQNSMKQGIWNCETHLKIYSWNVCIVKWLTKKSFYNEFHSLQTSDSISIFLKNGTNVSESNSICSYLKIIIIGISLQMSIHDQCMLELCHWGQPVKIDDEIHYQERSGRNPWKMIIYRYIWSIILQLCCNVTHMYYNVSYCKLHNSFLISFQLNRVSLGAVTCYLIPK